MGVVDIVLPRYLVEEDFVRGRMDYLFRISGSVKRGPTGSSGKCPEKKIADLCLFLFLVPREAVTYFLVCVGYHQSLRVACRCK